MSSADSPGLSTSGPKPVLIFDLDGTLLSVNSYPSWVRYLIVGHFPENKTSDRIKIGLQTIYLMLQRKLMNKDHAFVKAKLQGLWSKAAAKDPDSLAQDWLIGDLYSVVRPNLFPIMSRVMKQELDAILATAAAGEYAIPLGKKLGFKFILATPPFGTPGAGEENSGAVKRDRVLALLKENGWEDRPRIFFTDHADDMPLIEVCGKIFWFGPAANIQTMKTAHPDKKILNGLDLDGKEAFAALSE